MTPEHRFIETDNETLFKQAPMTAHDYMLKAVRDIDDVLGRGYAKAHPELIAAYMQTAAVDLGTTIIARAVDSIAAAVVGIEQKMDDLVDNVRSDHPLMGDGGISTALDNIATAIGNHKDSDDAAEHHS